MQKSIIHIIAALLIIAAAISSGCTGSGDPTPAENTPQATQATAEATETPAETPSSQTDEGLKPGEKVSSATVTNNSYTWHEYRDNTTTETPEGNIVQFVEIKRSEYSKTEYNGEPAVLLRINTNSVTQGWTSVSEFYYDESKTRRLYGKIVITDDNKPARIEEFAAEETGGGNSGFFGKDVMLTYLGTEPVTVPAGTFPDAGKYSYYYPDDNIEVTYWFAPGIPVPVLTRFKISLFAGCYGLESRELVGWG